MINTLFPSRDNPYCQVGIPLILNFLTGQPDKKNRVGDGVISLWTKHYLHRIIVSENGISQEVL